MKRTQLAILIFLLVVLGAAAWLLLARHTTSWQSSAGNLPERVVTLPINEVSRVTITEPGTKLDLLKKNGQWVVAERADYPANFEMISRLIRDVWELKPVQEVKVGPSQLGRLDLVEPGNGGNGGTLVEFRDEHGKRLAALLFGKKYMREANQSLAGRSFPAGRYVMPEDGSHRVSLVSNSFAQLEAKPERWLAREFIKIEKPVSIASAGPDASMNWELERRANSTEWKLARPAPGEELDQTKAQQIANAAGNISSFVDIMSSDAKPETTGLDKPRTFTVRCENGLSYVLKVGRENANNYPMTVSVTGNPPSATPTPTATASPAEKSALQTPTPEPIEKKLSEAKQFEGRVFLISKFTIDQLQKSRTDLTAPKPTPTPSPSPISQTPPKSR